MLNLSCRLEEQKTIATENIFDEDEQGKIGTGVGKIETFEKLGMGVGKVIEIKFSVRKDGEREAYDYSIPGVVKLDTMIIPSEVVTAVVSSNADEITLGSRFKDAISGRIGFIKDFLLCSDLIKTQAHDD